MDVSQIDPGILAAIGNTPLIRLNRLFPAADARIFGKLEFLMGIGLAQACCVLGLRLICVVDRKTTSCNVALLRAYGAKVDIVEAPHPVTGDWLDARIARIQDLLADTPGGWWPDQYGNVDNAIAHQVGTATEIARDFGGPPTVIVAAASTCGMQAGALGRRDRRADADRRGRRAGPPSTSTLGKVVPGVGQLLGFAGLQLFSGAFTHATGRVYIMHLETGGTLLDLDPRAVRDHFRREFAAGKQVASHLQGTASAGRAAAAPPIVRAPTVTAPASPAATSAGPTSPAMIVAATSRTSTVTAPHDDAAAVGASHRRRW